MGSGGSDQVNSSGKWKLSVGLGVLVGQLDHLVLERQQRAGVDLEREVQVERAAAGLLGVEVDLPRLAQRVGLDEVALVVHVEPVVDGVVLEVGDEPGDVDDGHVSVCLRVGSLRCCFGVSKINVREPATWPGGFTLPGRFPGGRRGCFTPGGHGRSPTPRRRR